MAGYEQFIDSADEILKNMDSIIQPVSTFATANQVESKPDKLDKVGVKLCAHHRDVVRGSH